MVTFSEGKIVELIIRYRKGDKSARDKLIREKLSLVYALAWRFKDRGDIEDLRQVGSIGLIKAIDRFKPQYGTKFVTFATSLIIGEIRQFTRDNGWPIKVSRRLKDVAVRLYKEREALRHALEREPTLSELADKLGVDSEELIWAEEISYSVMLSAEKLEKMPLESDGESNIEDQVINRLSLQTALSELCGRDRQLAMMRYFQEKTQAEIAEQLGISQVHVSRLEKKLLKKLKEIFFLFNKL